MFTAPPVLRREGRHRGQPRRDRRGHARCGHPHRGRGDHIHRVPRLASDTTARGRLNDAASTADQVYNWLRPGGGRCYSDTACAKTDGAAVAALQEAAGGQLTFDEWSLGTLPVENTIYVQVEADVGTTGKKYALGNSSSADEHNGIAGDPDAGDWIRLATRSDSGATFCVIKVA